MSHSKLTLIGMASYLASEGVDLFGDMTLPEGIDKDLLVNTFLQRGGEFEVIYSDPYFLKTQIGYWSRKWERTFTKWVYVLDQEYEPLYNLDVFEEWDEEHNQLKKFNGSIAKIGGSTDTNNLTQTNDLTRTDDLKTATNTDVTTENTRSAMDSATYQPYTKEQTTGDEDDNTVKNTGTVKDTGTVKNTGSVTRTDNETIGTDNTENNKLTDKHRSHRFGNQGITMSQQMLEAELNVQKWNLYDHITDIFLQEFVIPIYE